MEEQLREERLHMIGALFAEVVAAFAATEVHYQPVLSDGHGEGVELLAIEAAFAENPGRHDDMRSAGREP